LFNNTNNNDDDERRRRRRRHYCKSHIVRYAGFDWKLTFISLLNCCYWQGSSSKRSIRRQSSWSRIQLHRRVAGKLHN